MAIVVVLEAVGEAPALRAREPPSVRHTEDREGDEKLNHRKREGMMSDFSGSPRRALLLLQPGGRGADVVLVKLITAHVEY